MGRHRGNSSVGRAQPCQGWGREFESRFPLQISVFISLHTESSHELDFLFLALFIFYPSSRGALKHSFSLIIILLFMRIGIGRFEGFISRLTAFLV